MHGKGPRSETTNGESIYVFPFCITSPYPRVLLQLPRNGDILAFHHHGVTWIHIEVYKTSLLMSDLKKTWWSIFIMRSVRAIAPNQRYVLKVHSGYGLNQWETTLHCNVVSHWLSLYSERSLVLEVFSVQHPQYVHLCSPIWDWLSSLPFPTRTLPVHFLH